MPNIFNKEYYDNIWQGIHRHDYCDNLVDWLIKQYGKGKYLDIGTGCGYLVKILREKGCEAWGVEISEYALQNKCSDYVVNASVNDLPFKDQMFDVVHSQGLWEYIPEEDVPAAWKECLRVGKKQHHNYDAAEQWNPPEHQKITVKPRNWWEGKLVLPKILVACPVHECKEYSFQKWIDQVKKLTYPNIEVFVVDNSPTEDFMNRYRDQIPIVHIDVDQKEPLNRITKSMEVIRQKFLNGNYSHWFNLECDVMVPPNTIETMLEWGRCSDWIAHCYPVRGNTLGARQQGIGCSLMNKALVKSFDFSTAGAESPDCWLWEFVRNTKDFRTMELWGYLDTSHLNE